MLKRQADSDARYRSLLQKAVRRGHVDLVYTTSALIESMGSKGREWYRTQTGVITFAECWPYGAELIFNRKFHSKVAALVKVARALKARDASGLGYLAYALSKGDTSVYDGTPADKHIRIIANAIQRPDDFWRWIATRKKTSQQAALIENAMRFMQEGLPRDEVVIQAAVYLAVTGAAPEQALAQPADGTFPYWIVFDRHTLEGKLALREVARALHIPLPQLEWTCYYYEGARTNGETPSDWWERRCRWHFQKAGLLAEEAHLLWEPARPYVIDALAREASQIKNELYRWKLSNLKRIESLKRQVELFIEHFGDIQRDQSELFD